MTTRILVVGGYGTVGAHLCRALAVEGGLEVVVAGRRLASAEALAAKFGARARQIDLTDRTTWSSAVEGIDLVVMCMDQARTDFVAFVLRRGIRYADITAEDSFFRAVEALPAPARAAALLSVGLAPGLTNLLAIHAAAQLDSVEAVEIGMLFGLGDEHGDAALDWLAKKFFDPHRERAPLALDFGRGWGRRTAYPVDFSDRHALMRTRGFVANTRMAFESRLTTTLVFGFAGLFAGNRLMQSLTAAAFRRVRLGSRTVNLSVVAVGWKNGLRMESAARFHGIGEAQTTARLAALQIREFLDEPPPPGVWHSHEILDPARQFGAMEAGLVGHIDVAGRKVWIPENAYAKLQR
jgi:saccharopine dehydrogenase (NAD+, L-lysine-forming)